MVHDWLSGRKKGVLASFVVGTIDQVLFAALKSKHLVLRHLGLAGKVVLIDEVHAADDYMAVYLDRTLQWLGSYGVPVILLSATLPGERRAAMARAYDMGRGVHVDPPFVRPRRGEVVQTPITPYDELAQNTGYPLITATTVGPPVVHVVDGPGRRSLVHIAPLGDDDAALVSLLEERLTNGGCAVVIRNTVARAQHTFEQLRDRYDGELTLFHSRFVATDRMRREAQLRRSFGPPGPGVERPHRYVVVATQVVEQSLDLDFDLMVTDVAPIDLMLQRAGRLHRHARDHRPDGVHEPWLFVAGVENWADDVPKPDSGAVAVYGEHGLLRALAVLDVPARPVIRMPTDIPRLVHAAYAPTVSAPAGWEAAMTEAETKAQDLRSQRRRRAQDYLIGDPHGDDLVGWTAGVASDLTNEARGHAAVRDGQESLEVIVVQRRVDGQIYRWGAAVDEDPVPTELEPSGHVAHRLAADTLRLAPALTQPHQIDRTLDALEQEFFAGWQSSGWLREQLVLVFGDDCRCSLAGFQLSYHDDLGLVVNRERDSDD